MKILKLFFSIFLFPLSLFAQDTIINGTDTIIDYPFRLEAVRLSYDLGKHTYPWFDRSHGHTGKEVQFELLTNKNKVFVAEAGIGAFDFQKKNDVKDVLYHYKSNNQYMRLGVDFNRNIRNDDMAGFGLRYGYGRGEHSYSDLMAINELSASNGAYTGLRMDIATEQYSFHWLEMAFSVKVELFANVFLGWVVRGKIRVKDSPFYYEPYSMDGFGKLNKKISGSFNYYICYQIGNGKKRPYEK